ncbi:MAG: hypothetical protein ACOY71_02550 [Gemmatimonadota bacterium]
MAHEFGWLSARVALGVLAVLTAACRPQPGGVSVPPQRGDTFDADPAHTGKARIDGAMLEIQPNTDLRDRAGLFRQLDGEGRTIALIVNTSSKDLKLSRLKIPAGDTVRWVAKKMNGEYRTQFRSLRGDQPASPVLRLAFFTQDHDYPFAEWVFGEYAFAGMTDAADLVALFGGGVRPWSTCGGGGCCTITTSVN